MKKKITIISLLMLMISIISVKAATFSNYLPGGKNYLYENNFLVSENSLQSIHDFVVKESTFYTLSMPGTGMLGNDLSIEIAGNYLYYDGNVLNDPSCVIREQLSYCTFETVSGEDYLSLRIYSAGIGNYIEYYGFTGFQLEEGTVPTNYEEYVISLSDISDPEFSGSGAYIKSYTSFETINSIINEHLVVIDRVDGNVTNSIVIISDQYTGNEQIVGEYLVELSASDTSGNTAYFNLSILVKDEIEPTISGPIAVSIDVNEGLNLIEIINNNFIINDEYGSTTVNVLVDNYTLNNDVVGTYLVYFEAVDDYQNSVDETFHITLFDNDLPMVTSSLNITSYLSNPYTVATALSTLTFSDNYDDMSNTIINIISDDFIGNESIPGTYIINFEVSDSSGNTLNSNLVINVIDDVTPEIGGPITYQGSYTEELILNDFLNMLTVSDNVDLIDLIDLYIIEDTYTDRISDIGNFSIVFGVMDGNLNVSTHTISITIFDDVPPIIYIDNYIVTVSMSSTFTTDDAVTLLINSEELIEGSYSVEKLFDGYSGNESNEGTYVYLLEFTNETGESYEKEFIVKVIDDKEIEYSNNLIVRNIIMYSISISIFGFIVLKNKK